MEATQRRLKDLSLGAGKRSRPHDQYPDPTDEISLIPENDGGSETIQDQTKVEAVPAPEWDEDTSRPPQGRMEDRGPVMEDVEAVLDDVSFKVETPLPDQEVKEAIENESIRSAAEVEAESGETLDDTSFKFFTPQPDQDIMESIEGEGARSDVLGEEETGEILDEGSFKPIPAQASAEEIGHEDHWSLEEDGGPETEDGTEEGGSILIGEEGELEQIDLTAEAAKEVEEYWEPPEMYVYQNKDGTIEFVDKNGKPIDSPPMYKVNSKDNTIQAWYQGIKKAKCLV